MSGTVSDELCQMWEVCALGIEYVAFAVKDTPVHWRLLALSFRVCLNPKVRQNNSLVGCF